ncbi:hypothetical protein IOC57_09765 [Bacillus sp. SD075]|uniref:hypothetical protein n=1 Tax=Bacillus sp. SD075 TaxID=2781732 RepID=UPI001A973D84|nr:hypothetical protein [Bacillus sp. SD075]MBO0998034.1 hypothetical protein [Bacillus sp. SD075]
MKEFAAPLPNNWLVETQQTLALMRLCIQSAERGGFLKSTGAKIWFVWSIRSPFHLLIRIVEFTKMNFLDIPKYLQKKAT